MSYVPGLFFVGHLSGLTLCFSTFSFFSYPYLLPDGYLWALWCYMIIFHKIHLAGETGLAYDDDVFKELW